MIRIAEIIDLKKLLAKLTWLVFAYPMNGLPHLSRRRGRRHLVLCERSLLIGSGSIPERTALDLENSGPLPGIEHIPACLLRAQRHEIAHPKEA